MLIFVRVLAVLITLIGVATFALGVGSFQMVDQTVEIMRMMREGGYPALPGVDLETFRYALYGVAINYIITGGLSAISGIGIFFRKNWARSLYLVTLVLMLLGTAYTVAMNLINQAELGRIASNGLILIIYVALFYFFSRKKTKELFVRSDYAA